MGEKIQSKIFQHGNDHESSWPSEYGEGERGIFHIKDGKIIEGNPENPNNLFGTSAMVIFDSMPMQYHEAACRPVESRKEWARLDKEHNTVTFGSLDESKRTTANGRAKEKAALKADRKKSIREASQAYKENPKYVKEKLKKEGEKQYEVAKKSGLTKILKSSGIDI